MIARSPRQPQRTTRLRDAAPSHARPIPTLFGFPGLSQRSTADDVLVIPEPVEATSAPDAAHHPASDDPA
jgi:hypothetical protein